MVAATDDLDDLMRGHELSPMYDRRHRLPHGRRGILVDAATGLADQEGDNVAGAVTVQAGDIGIARAQAVHEPLLDQEIQGAIDRDRRETPATGRRNAIGQIIGADRAMVGMQGLQGLATDRRQSQAALPAELLGARQRFRGMTLVILGMATGRMVMAVMRVGVWLHFHHVALQYYIGQRAATAFAGTERLPVQICNVSIFSARVRSLDAHVP